MISAYFKILELDENASISEIKKAYRTLAKKYHPDINHFDGASELFILINEAYEMLLKWYQNKPLFETTKTETKPFDKEEWLKNERIKARKRAVENARIKYEEFKKTRIYKTSQIFISLTDLVFIGISLTIIISPILFTLKHGFEPQRVAMGVTAVIASTILGIVMLILVIKNSNIFNKESF